MYSFAFPTLDSLRKGSAPVAPTAASVDWIDGLGSSAAPPAPQAAGWLPPTLATVNAPTLDVEMERRIAQEEGFRNGYAEGVKAGTERGLAEGRRVGREDALAAQREAIDQFRSALESVLAKVDPAVERWQASVEERATSIVMDAVHTLLATELATGRPSALGIVRQAMGHAEGALRATVRLSPFDRAELVEHREEIMAACAGLRELELVDDRSITGGCIIETENGVVDATLSTRLSLLEAA